ncbi:hypothetical protein ACJX0J_031906 [Zea mays]
MTSKISLMALDHSNGNITLDIVNFALPDTNSPIAIIFHAPYHLVILTRKTHEQSGILESSWQGEEYSLHVKAFVVYIQGDVAEAVIFFAGEHSMKSHSVIRNHGRNVAVYIFMLQLHSLNVYSFLLLGTHTNLK